MSIDREVTIGLVDVDVEMEVEVVDFLAGDGIGTCFLEVKERVDCCISELVLFIPDSLFPFSLTVAVPELERFKDDGMMEVRFERGCM